MKIRGGCVLTKKKTKPIFVSFFTVHLGCVFLGVNELVNGALVFGGNDFGGKAPSYPFAGSFLPQET